MTQTRISKIDDIENNQEIIGTAVLCKTEHEGEANLISFYLLPDRIGQGFGHMFYNAIEADLKNRGFQNCVIDVLKNNKRAIHFYEAYFLHQSLCSKNSLLRSRSFPQNAIVFVN